jgi:UDP-N-acetylmuramoyl-tripeptide--D-alanyl-D-alanine ligase
VAAVLNVGTAHIGEFGSREAIARAKGEIVEALPADGTAVLNGGDDLVAAMASRTRARVLRFGGPPYDVSAREVEIDDLGRPSFEIGYDGAWQPVRLQQVGSHQVENALAAAAMALAVGLPLDRVAAALSAATSASPMRMELHERPDGLIVINDAYNANPASMTAALEALVTIGRRRARRTVAVLGEMLELGEQTHAGHVEVGQAAARLGVDVVVVVGEPSRGIAEGFGDEAILTAGRAEAIAWVRENVAAGDVVLVKASRGAALEEIADRLLEVAVEGEASAP